MGLPGSQSAGEPRENEGAGRQPEGRDWDCCPATAPTAPLAWGQSLGDNWQVGHPVPINWMSARAWRLTGKPSLYCLKVGVLRQGGAVWRP